MISFPFQFITGIVATISLYFILVGFGRKVSRKTAVVVCLLFTMPVMMGAGGGHGGTVVFSTTGYILFSILSGNLGYHIVGHLIFAGISLPFFLPIYLILFRKIDENNDNFFSSDILYHYRARHPFKFTALSVTLCLCFLSLLSLGFYRNVYLPDNFIDYHKADVTLRIPKGGYYAYEVIRFRVDDFSPYGLPENANRHTTIPMNSEHISVKLSIKGGGDSEAHQTRFSEGRLYRALNTLAVVKQPKNLEFVPRVRKENTDFGLVRYINPEVDLDRYEWPLPDDEVYVLEGDVNHLYFICKEWNDQKHTCHTEVNLGPRVIAKIVFNFDNLKDWKRIVTNVYAKLREWNQSYNLPVAISE